LHRELNEKQSAPVESNLSKELQDNLDSVNAELKKKLEEKEAENAKLKEENQKTKEESKKAKEELSKSTEIMKKFIEKAKKNR
jgi:cell division protein FtsB